MPRGPGPGNIGGVKSAGAGDRSGHGDRIGVEVVTGVKVVEIKHILYLIWLNGKPLKIGVSKKA